MASEPAVRLISERASTIAFVRRSLDRFSFHIEVQSESSEASTGPVAAVILDARGWPETRVAEWLTRSSGARLVIVDEIGATGRAFIRGIPNTDIVLSDIDAAELRTRVESLLKRERALQVLLVEDEPRLAEQIARLIEAQGFKVTSAATLKVADHAVVENAFDVIVLDRGLADGDGLEFLQRLRARGVSTPTVILSAMGDPVQRIDGLRGGADDYMVKPFDPGELLARIEVLLRPVIDGDLHRLGALEIYRGDRLARWRGARIDLTDTEFRLLAYLAERPGLVLPVSMLRADVWDILRQHTETNIVAAGIRRLRRKLAEAGVPDVISTQADGYRFDLLSLLVAGDD